MLDLRTGSVSCSVVLGKVLSRSPTDLRNDLGRVLESNPTNFYPSESRIEEKDRQTQLLCYVSLIRVCNKVL